MRKDRVRYLFFRFVYGRTYSFTINLKKKVVLNNTVLPFSHFSLYFFIILMNKLYSIRNRVALIQPMDLCLDRRFDIKIHLTDRLVDTGFMPFLYWKD